MVEQKGEELVVQRACRRRAAAAARRLLQRGLVLFTHVAEDGGGLGLCVSLALLLITVYKVEPILELSRESVMAL